MSAPFDLRSLEVVRAIAAEGSVSAAARRLGRVQSNLSMRLKDLEQRLGCRLFLRHKSGLTPTEDGERLIAAAERVFTALDEAGRAFLDAAPSGPFRIGTMESTAIARLPAVLAAYHKLAPQVRIELVTDTAGGLLERLGRGDLDAAFVAEPVSLERFHTRAVFVEELTLITPSDFPEGARPQGLSGRTIIAFPVGCAYRRYLEDWLLTSGVEPGTPIAMASYPGLLSLVSAGTGFAVVPRSVLTVLAPENPAFQVHDLPAPLDRIHTLLVWRDESRSARLKALLDQLPCLTSL
ncbi:MAG: LysR substrate-binding domain-containing protein [Rhodospirillales bacterium]